MTSCVKCGRELKSPASIEAGMGPVCAGHEPGEKKARKPRALKAPKKAGPSGGKITFKKKPEAGNRFHHFSQDRRASYKAFDDGEFLILIDQDNGNVSLTNYMSEALYECYYHEEINIYNRKIIYSDSEKMFDAVILKSKEQGDLLTTFYFQFEIKPIREKNIIQAKNIYNVRYGVQAS
jgi:hypothetical protein